MKKQDIVAILLITLTLPLILYWGLPSGERFKFITLGLLTSTFIIIALIDIKISVLLVLLWLPFKGLIRRLFYLIAPFGKYDIIHLTEPIYLVFIFLLLLAFERRKFLKEFRENRIFRIYLLLLAIFIIQIFNPLQGSVITGFAGAIFTLFPALWFIIGLFYGDERLTKKVLSIVAITSFITAIYGIFQFFHGILPFEKYWIKNVQKYYSTITLIGYPRAFSTFMSPEESSRYFEIGALVIAGQLILKKNLLSLGILIPTVLAIIFTGVRSSLFGFLFGTFLIFTFSAKNIRKAILRGAITFIFLYCLIEFLIPSITTPRYTNPVEFYSYHITRGLKNPTGEQTFKIRLKIWNYLLTDYIFKYPVGYGLGSGTLAGRKFGGKWVGTESYLFTLIPSAGIIGFLLFTYLFYQIIKTSGKKIVHETYTSRIAFSIVCAMMLNNIFGNTFGMYTTGAVGWFLSGALSRAININIIEEHQKFRRLS